MAPYLYTTYGLSLACDFALPELPPLGAGSGEATLVTVAAHDVTVRLGAPLEAGRFAATGESLLDDSGVACLAWEGVGRFWLRAGRQVLVEPQQGTDEAQVRAHLLGPVLAAVLSQRGLLVLHASAVALRGREGEWGAVAFVGESGQGKSTMAAALHARGCPVVADDILAVPVAPPATEPAPRDGGTTHRHPLVSPGFARLSLFPDSLRASELLGLDGAFAVRGVRASKLACATVEGFRTEALPLRCVYVLGDGARPRFVALPAARRIIELSRHSYRAVPLSEEALAAQFARCGVVARSVSVRELQRPRDLSCLDEAARLIQNDQGSS